MQSGVRSWMAEMDRRVDAYVQRYGMTVMSVGGDEARPEWAYTIGLQRRFGHPEVGISGLPTKTAHAILNEIARRVARGEDARTGTLDASTLARLPCAFRSIRGSDLDAHHWAMGLRHYGGTHFDALQLVWPDPRGRFPWEPGWETEPAQELLYAAELLRLQ
jgi:hypothetical protein